MNKDTIERTCPVCGVTYAAEVGRLKHGRQTTCSRACSYALRVQGRQNATRFVCGVCGSEVKRTPSQIKSKHGAQFCSRACHYAGRATGASKRVVAKPYVISDAAREGWKAGGVKAAATRRARDNYRHSEQTRRKLAEATARALAERKPYVVSKLEDKVAAQFDALGVAYEHQRPFRNGLGQFAFVVDFWLPAFGVAVEVNGTYWHVDPRVYAGPINDTQRRCLDRYARKVECLKALGVPLVELWEMDLKERPAETVIEAYRRLAAG